MKTRRVCSNQPNRYRIELEMNDVRNAIDTNGKAHTVRVVRVTTILTVVDFNLEKVRVRNLECEREILLSSIA